MIACILALVAGEGVKNVRIVEGVDKMSIKDEPYPDAIIPDPLSGPESLYFLNGLCFVKSIDRFEYSVCPFQNITQRRITGQYGNTLGTWGSWIIDDTSGPKDFRVMKYNDGKSCGESKVDTTLILECGNEDFDVLSANDSVFCKYIIKLGIPIACSLLRK